MKDEKYFNYAGTAKWAQLDLQSIQHRDYFGHLSIFRVNVKINYFSFSFGKNLLWIFVSIVVSIPACHAGAWGSIPRQRVLFFLHLCFSKDFFFA